jgi:hypothetical protein
MPGLLGPILIDGHEVRPSQLGHWEYLQLRRNLESWFPMAACARLRPSIPCTAVTPKNGILTSKEVKSMPWCLRVKLAPATNKKRIGAHQWERWSKSQVISRRFPKAGKTVGDFNIFDTH